MEPDAAARHQTALDEQVGAAREQSTGLQQRIAALKARPAAGPDARIQKNQTELVAKKFVAALQNYQNVERDYRAKYRTRVERQFKLGATYCPCAEKRPRSLPCSETGCDCGRGGVGCERHERQRRTNLCSSGQLSKGTPR
jgi:hypothetical protein